MVPTAVRTGLASGTLTVRAVSERMVGSSVDIVISRHWPVVDPCPRARFTVLVGVRIGIGRPDDMATSSRPNIAQAGSSGSVLCNLSSQRQFYKMIRFFRRQAGAGIAAADLRRRIAPFATPEPAQ